MLEGSNLLLKCFIYLRNLFNMVLPVISPIEWILVMVLGMLVGMSKVGVPGVSMLVVPAMAFIFGGKPSTGVLLPMLIMADFFGVGYYHRHANKLHLMRTLPWAVLGLLVGLWAGDMVNDLWFTRIIALLVFLSLGIMLLRKQQYGPIVQKIWFAPILGIIGGFATMMGNVAGPVFAVYLLAMHLSKHHFIGTTAWFFLIINLIKFPLQLLVWDNITNSTLLLNLFTLPAIAAGAFAGIKLVKLIPEQTFRLVVMVITALSALLLLV